MTKFWLVLSGLAFLTQPAWAQIVSGSIGGTVVDSSHAVIPSAHVMLVNQDTKVVREGAARETGSFSFLALSPGRYQVSASSVNFKTTVVSDIELQIDQAYALGNLVLEPGDRAESITVEASVVALQTESANLGRVFTQRTIGDLPLNGRNFLQLAALSAGVVPATDDTGTSRILGRSDATIHVAGGRTSFTSYLLDGQESRGTRFGEATFLPSPDAIQEFKIQRNFYSAEYGSSPAVVSVSTKSGTNTLHGSLYEFLRNSALDTPSYFDGGSPPPFRLNQFGGTVGGPLILNSTFFFGGYEGRRQRLATQRFATVPTPVMLLGDFSSLNTIKDPFNNGLPFPDNKVPVNAFAQAYNKFIPAPNSPTPQGNYAGAPSTTNDFDQYHVRLDQRFSERDSLFGRYSQSDWVLGSPGLLPQSGAASPVSTKNAVVQETHLFNADFLNTLKLGYARSLEANSLQPAEGNLAAQIGLQNLVVGPADYGIPRVMIAGYERMGNATPMGSLIALFRTRANTFNLSDTINRVRGRHSMVVGADIRAHRIADAAAPSNGALTFDGQFTGNAVADYLLGAYSTAGATANSVVRDFRYTQYALFFQDNYKVSTRLALNLGLRWEYNQPMRELGGSEGFFDPSIGGLRLAYSPSIYGIAVTSQYIQVGGLRRGVVKPQFLNFAPRLGFAYSIGAKTVLRGGVGIFYADYQLPDQSVVGTNPGAGYNATYINSQGLIPRLDSSLFDKLTIAGLPSSTQLSVTDPDRKTQYMEQVSFEIQRELPGSLFIEIGYLGNEGHHIIGRRDLNQARLNAPGQNLAVVARRPYPQFSSINQFFGGENSNYNGLTVNLERRFASGIGFLADYTLAKAMDAFSGSPTDFHQIPDYRLDYARATFDIRRRLSASLSYELPFGVGKRYLISAAGLAKWAVSGWQINTVVQFQSGLPFSILLASDQSNTGAAGRQRPNRIANGALAADQRTPNLWFDTSAFALNPSNTYGNSGRNILEQDGVKTVDLSILKTARLADRLALQFRAEIFNLFNADNFGPPGAVLDGPSFGVVTTVGPARQVQLALKLLF